MKTNCDLLSTSETSTESKTDQSDYSEATLNAYINAHTQARSFPELENLNVVTSKPSTLSYHEAVLNTLPNIPTILVELVERIDREIPPLHHICYGINETTLAKCDRMLDVLLKSKNDGEFRTTMIARCEPQEAAQMIQLLFLRLENPPFMASPSFCDAVNEKGFFFAPRMINRKECGSNLIRIIKECLRNSSIYQQATLSYFIERCQRWCQAEVGYFLAKDPSTSATATYSESIRFLGSMFADCLIGLPRNYIASKIMASNCDPWDEFKKDIFLFLIGVIGSHVWHGNSIETLYIPGQPSDTSTSDDTRKSLSSDNSYTKTSGLHKIRSFNWI